MLTRLKTSSRTFTALVALLCALAVAAPAIAVPVAVLDVTLLLRPAGLDEPLLLISGSLPDGQELPAEVSLALPAGAEIIWAGEVFGGDIANDIQVEPVVVPGETHDIATITLTQARIAQIEVIYPEGRTVDDIGSIAAFQVPSATAAAQARLAIAVPTTLQARQALVDIQASATPDATYYYQELTDVAVGDPLGLRVELVAATPVSQGSPAGGGIPPVVLALAAAAIAVGAIAFVAARKQQPATEGYDDVVDIEEYDGSHESAEHVEAPGYAQSAVADGAEETTVEEHAYAQDEVEHAQAVPAARAGGRSNRMLVTVAVVVVLGLLVGVIAFGQGEPVGVMSIGDGVVSQRISTAEAVEDASWEVAWPCGCPPEAEAPKIFGALTAVPGVAYAQLRTSDLVLQVSYDPAVATPEAIATALRQAGYVN